MQLKVNGKVNINLHSENTLLKEKPSLRKKMQLHTLSEPLCSSSQSSRPQMVTQKNPLHFSIIQKEYRKSVKSPLKYHTFFFINDGFPSTLRLCSVQINVIFILCSSSPWIIHLSVPYFQSLSHTIWYTEDFIVIVFSFLFEVLVGNTSVAGSREWYWMLVLVNLYKQPQSRWDSARNNITLHNSISPGHEMEQNIFSTITNILMGM